MIEGVNLAFSLRNESRGQYLVTVDGAGYCLVRQQFAPNPLWSELDRLETKTDYSGEHEVLFAAVGERLVFCLDGQPILHGRDATPLASSFTLGTGIGSIAEFRSIEFLVLDDPPDPSVLAALPPAKSPFIGPDGNWRLPPGAPQPAICPFDVQQAKVHQEAWAKHLSVSVETTNSIGMKLVLIPPGEFDMGSTQEDVDRLLAEAKQSNEPSEVFDNFCGRSSATSRAADQGVLSGGHRSDSGPIPAVCSRNRLLDRGGGGWKGRI
jgi:hypothetical protein